MPASNIEYWQRKFRRNVERDRANRTALEQAGWRVIVVWECEIRDREALLRRLRTALVGDARSPDLPASLMKVAEHSSAYDA